MLSCMDHAGYISEAASISVWEAAEIIPPEAQIPWVHLGWLNISSEQAIKTL